MKRLALGMVTAAVLGIAIGVQSFVYACDRSHQAQAKTAVVVAPAIQTEVAASLDHVRIHRVSMVLAPTDACTREKPTAAQSVRRTAKVAATLGRALVTTVGAVVGTLVDAAVDATASLV